jgi:hypothetical protein
LPTLEITEAMVGPDRTPLALSYIASVMLWPRPLQDDERRRDEWMKAATASSIRDATDAVPTAKRVAEAGQWLNRYDLAREAMPMRILEQQSEQPFIHGCLAGELLFAAVEQYAERGFLKREISSAL